MWQQNLWNVISNARGNPRIAKHNKATVPKCEASFPTSGATLELANTIKLLWPSVTAKPMKRHFQQGEQPWDCQTQSDYCDEARQQNLWNVISYAQSNTEITKRNQTTCDVAARIIFDKNCPHFDFLSNIEPDFLYRTGSRTLETSKHLGDLQLQAGSRHALITLPV